MALLHAQNQAEVEALMRDPDYVKTMRFRANLGALVGTTIEWYEYFAYGSMAAIVFPQLFFPAGNHFVSLMLSFATFAVAFVVRPIGGAIFGQLGDKIGRKRALIITLVTTGLVTFGVGVLPTWAQVGMAAPILLLSLRVLQGLGVGGEWGGSVAMALEWGDKKKSGLAGAWPQMGSPLGLITATGMVTLISAITTDQQWMSWGWRIPFLFSGVLLAIGLIVRLRMAETPAFLRRAHKDSIARSPVKTVIRTFPKELILSAFLRLSEQAPFYIFTVYILSYATTTDHIDRSLVLGATMVAAALDLILVPLFAQLGDRLGRRTMYYAGCIALVLMAFPYFAVVDHGSPTAIFCMVSCSLLPHALQYGSQSSLIAEQFPAELRASGSSIGYQLASIVAGGPAPMIAAWLVQEFASGDAVAAYLVVCGIIAAIALRLMPRRGRLGD